MAGLERAEPSVGFRVRLELGGTVAGWFTEVGNVTVERDVQPQSEGGVNDHQHWLPGGVKWASLTLRRGIASDALWQWFRQGLYDARVEQRTVTVILLGPDGTTARKWDLPAAMPLRWGGVQLQSDSGQVLVEELELGLGGEQAPAIQRSAGAVCDASARRRPAGQALDLPLLARKVFDLLKQDLRVEQERQGRI